MLPHAHTISPPLFCRALTLEYKLHFSDACATDGHRDTVVTPHFIIYPVLNTHAVTEHPVGAYEATSSAAFLLRQTPQVR